MFWQLCMSVGLIRILNKRFFIGCPPPLLILATITNHPSPFPTQNHRQENPATKMTHTLTVEPAVFTALPKLSVSVAVVRNIDLANIDRPGIQKLLQAAWLSSRQQTSAYPTVQAHPNIQLWRVAFTSLKVSTKKYISSMESMAKRAAKADSTAFSINPLVDLYNAFSLKYTIPFGGFDMDSDVSRDMRLRFSESGVDKFLALDSDAPIDVPDGEVLYASGNTVVTRHINWRQSKEGLIGENSVNVCLIAEVLGGYPDGQLQEMEREFRAACVDLLHVQPEFFTVNQDRSTFIY